MYAQQAKSFRMCTMKQKMYRKRSFSKCQAVQGIGDVVHINVYESLTERLDSIEKKLFQIETYITNEHVISNEDNDEKTREILELKEQMDEAVSDARRKALHAQIIKLSSRT